MANFATASDALTAALATVDSRLTNIEIGEELELYLELIQRRAAIQDAIAASGGGGGGTTPSTTATTTSVASSATSVPLLAANSSRKFASFRNDSTSVAYIELGATATSSSVYRLEAQGFLTLDNYTGAISCIWASANGNMRVTEGV